MKRYFVKVKYGSSCYVYSKVVLVNAFSKKEAKYRAEMQVCEKEPMLVKAIKVLKARQ